MLFIFIVIIYVSYYYIIVNYYSNHISYIIYIICMYMYMYYSKSNVAIRVAGMQCQIHKFTEYLTSQTGTPQTPMVLMQI